VKPSINLIEYKIRIFEETEKIKHATALRIIFIPRTQLALTL
jgi:hypothetical protein